MRALVVGAGAVGSWLGGSLALGGADVVMAEPGPRRARLAEGGLTLRTKGRTVRVQPEVVASVSEAMGSGPFDLGIVAVKSFHTATVADEITAAGSPERIASFQNGIGNDDVLARVPGVRLVTATLTTGLQIDADEGIVHGADKGGVGIGLTPEGPLVDDLVAALSAGGLDVRTYSDPLAMKWSKLLLNVIGSATSAVLGWPPGRVFSDPRLFEIERVAWMEAVSVMRASGMAPVKLPGYPVPLFARGAKLLPPRLTFRLFGGRLAGARGNRLPSVAADLAAGRSQTENHVLSGAVARTGKQLRVPVPLTRTLSDLVEAIASGQIDRQSFASRPDTLLSHLGASIR